MPRPEAGWSRILLSVGATGALLAWVAWRYDLRSVVTQLAQLRVGWVLLAALALGPAQVACSAERWRGISARLHEPIPRGSALREVALSMLLNQLLPGGVAGDAIRAWRTSHGGVLGSVRAVVADRVLAFGVHVVVVASSLALWLAWAPVPLPAGAAPLVGALLAVLIGLVAVPAGTPGLGVLGRDLRAVLGAADGVAGAVGWSVLANAAFLGGLAACGSAVGCPLGAVALVAGPLILLSMAVPVGFGGLGVREAAAALLLPRFGFAPEQALAISAAYGIAGTLGALPGAGAPLWR